MRLDSVAEVLADAVTYVPGWTPHEQLVALFHLALVSAPLGGDLLELGSWCGRSAVALGLAARTTGCQLHCIDLFPTADDWHRNADGTYSLRVQLNNETVDAYDAQTVWQEPFERDIRSLYEERGDPLSVFHAVMARYGLQGCVHAYRGTSALLDDDLPPGLRLRVAFVDGDHGFKAVFSDIGRIVPRLLHGGWLCFDDAFTSYAGVDRAIRECVISSAEFDMSAQVTRKMFIARRHHPREA